MVRNKFLLVLLSLILLGVSGCERICIGDVCEGEIRYTDIDFPPDEDDNDSGGGPGSGTMTITLTGGSNSVTESGAGDNFTVVLDAAPTDNVTVAVSSGDTGEVTVSPSILTFTPGNYNSAQTVSLTPIEDYAADSNQSVTITLVVTSSDTIYHGVTDTTPVTVVDSNQTPGLTFTLTSGTNSVTESGAGDTLSIVLDTSPTNDVTLSLTSSDTGEFTLSPSTIVFGSGNYSSSQTITLTAIEDNVTDNNQNETLTVTTSSTDSNYNGLSDTTPVTVVDSGNTPPSAVSNLSATAPYSNQVDLSWTATTNTDNYTIYFSTNNISFSAISPVVTGTTYSHTGRTAATTYYYYLISNNAYGVSGQSNTANATTLGAPTVTLTATTSVAEGNSGTTNRTITATQSQTATTNTTVTLTATGTATGSGTDYTLNSSTITITAGSTTGTTSVDIVGDLVAEDNETIILDITGVSGGDSATESGTQQETITITNDDIADITVTVSTNNTVTESGAGDTFTVELDTSPTSNVTLTLVSTDMGEFTLSPSTVVFSSGNYSSAQTITLTAVEDNATDTNQNENVTISASSADTFYNGLSTTSPVTIIDSGNEPPSVPVSNLSVTAVSTTQIDLSWSASVNTDNYTVYFSTDNSSFSAISPVVTGTSYSHTGRTPGTTYYYYLISNNAYGVSGQSNRADDTTTSILVDVSADITSVTEGDSGFQTITVTATQSQTAATNTTVTFSTTSVPSDAATSTGVQNYTKDYGWISSSITITAGSTTGSTTLRVHGDEVDEDNETIYVNVNVSGAGSENGTQTANISIIDDDTAGYRFQHTGDNTTVTEQGTVGSYTNTDNMTVNLQTRPASGVVVISATSADTGEFTVSPDNVTFDSDNWSTNQIFTVTGVQDNIDDGDQSPNITLTIVDAATADTKFHPLSNKNKTVDVINVVAPILDNVTAGIGQITAYWSAFTGATVYKLYYDTNPNVSTSDSFISIDNNSTSYIHSGRIPSTTYYYALVATTASGDSVMSLEKSTAATAFPGCDELGYRSDNDTDLVVHYPFQNNGEDILDTNGDGRYDMSNTNGTMQYTPGCATGQSLYIDSTSGVMRNDNFNDTNLGGNIASGNFTISFWTVRDGDMVKFSSAVNTGLKGAHAPGGDWSSKTQFDVGTGGSLRWISQYATMGTSINLTENEWYHVAGTVDSSGRGTLYINGKQEASNASFQGNFKALMVGVNRSADYSTRHWKGYVDELKVYKRTMTTDEVIEKCFFESNNCGYLLTTAPSLTASPRASSIYLSWNQLVGSDNATIYWRSSSGFEGSPATPTASDNTINTADNQTSYFLANLDPTKYYHFVIKANNRNGSSNVSSIVSNVQPLNARFRSTSVNSNTLVYINRDNELWVRGNNWSPSEGGNAEIYLSPRTSNFGEPNSVHADSISNASVVGAGLNKISALLDNGTVYHFHTNNSSLFWDSYNTETTPTNIPGGTTIVDMRHSLKAVYYLLSDGTILAKGRNHVGQLGNGTTTDETGSTGVFVSGINSAIQIAVGIQHACALLSNGQVWCWGDGDKGELGDGLDTDSSTPVQVSLPTNTATMIDGTYNDTFALMSDGTVYGWGENRSGKIKCSSDNSQVLSPERVSGLSNIIDIAVGYETVHLLEDDDNDGRGTLYTCGRANKNYDLTNNAAFRFWNDNNADINYIASYNGTGNAIKADEYNNRIIQIDADRYALLLIRDDLVLMGIGQSNHKQFSTTDNNGANRMVIFDDNLQPIESTNDPSD